MIALISVLSLAPGIHRHVTASRASLLRCHPAVGHRSAVHAANIVLISLALFMTFFVMAPVFDRCGTKACSR